jgi:hypothetical protein
LVGLFTFLTSDRGVFSAKPDDIDCQRVLIICPLTNNFASYF